MWQGDNSQPPAVTTRLGSFTVWAGGALLQSDSIGRSAWHCLLFWLSSFFLDANLWFISDWPRWALSLMLLCGACHVILACTEVLDCGLSVQAWPVERGRWERESEWERVTAWKELRMDFCSEPVHWMLASNAACLPMAQLFANLSPFLPSSTDWPSVHPPAHPGPPSSPQPRWLKKKKKKKQERSNLALSPSYCQGLLEKCETRQSWIWLSHWVQCCICSPAGSEFPTETEDRKRLRMHHKLQAGSVWCPMGPSLLQARINSRLSNTSIMSLHMSAWENLKPARGI